MPTDAKITIELPEGVSKEEILKEIENLIRLKKYEIDRGFSLLNDYDKKRALKIAEFVENYLKKHYPKIKFKIRLEYDDFEDEINVRIIFKSKLSSEERLKILDELDKAVIENFSRVDRNKIYIVYI
jgi:DNA gyrase/topoisomerase IV subunit A